MRAAAESDGSSTATQPSVDEVTGFRIDSRRDQVSSDTAWYTRCVDKTSEPNRYCSAIAVVLFYVHWLKFPYDFARSCFARADNVIVGMETESRVHPRRTQRIRVRSHEEDEGAREGYH